MDKAKRIEEMTKDIQKAVEGCSKYWAELIAKYLTEQGYRKIDENSVVFSRERFNALETIEKYHIKSCGKDSVVLSREEYEELKSPRFIIETKKVTNKEVLEKLRSSTFAIVDNNAKIEIIPTRQEIEKETAKKILKEIRGYYPINKECCDKGEFFIICLCDDLAKNYGVEVDDCGK